MDMTKVLKWAMDSGFEPADVLADPSHFVEAYEAAHSPQKKASGPAKYYTTIVLLRDDEDGNQRRPVNLGRVEAKRGKGAKGAREGLQLALHAALLIHGLEPDDVVGIVQSPLKTLEEFFKTAEE